MDELQQQLSNIQQQIADEKAKGGARNDQLVAQLEQQEADILAKMDDITNGVVPPITVPEISQSDNAASIKSTIFDILEKMFPDSLAKVVGLTEYNEMMQDARQLIDAAVDENQAALYAAIGSQFDAKDAQIHQITANNITLTTQLQESQRKEQAAQQTAQQAMADKEQIAQENEQLKAQIAEKDAAIAEKDQQLQAKDDQIAKLTDELNKPKTASGIILPGQSGPSQSLQDRLKAAEAKVKSQLDIVLAGSAFRGKIEVPPLQTGGSDDNVSFPGQTAESNATDSGVSNPEVAPSAVDSQFQSKTESTTAGLATDTAVPQGDGTPVTRAEFEALTQRVAALEGQKVDGAAA